MRLFRAPIFALWLLTSCAYSPKHYTAPTAAPVRKAIAVTQRHVMAAQDSAKDVSGALNKLEVLTRKDPTEHALVVESQKDMDTLGRELWEAQKELIDAQDQVGTLQDKVQEVTDKLNVDEQKIAELKPKPHFSVLGIAENIVSFILNPLGWLVGKTINLIIGLAISIILLSLAWWGFRRWRRLTKKP